MVLVDPTCVFVKSALLLTFGLVSILLDSSVTLENGETISFDKLCIATGGKTVVPQVDGVGLKGVFTLRTKQDQE